jgi:hypothetical protein
MNEWRAPLRSLPALHFVTEIAGIDPTGRLITVRKIVDIDPAPDGARPSKAWIKS